MFNEELNLVKKEFNRQSPLLTPFQPHYAGMATWARSLKKRVDTPMKVSYERGREGGWERERERERERESCVLISCASP